MVVMPMCVVCRMSPADDPTNVIGELRPGSVLCEKHYQQGRWAKLEDKGLKELPIDKYKHLGQEIGALVDKKQREYGDSFGRAGAVLRCLWPDGVRPAQYDDLLAVVRVIDKLFRVATRAEGDAESPWRDVAGYGLLGAMKDDNRS